jgi:N-acetyl-gamma-glutamyl-phosphate reductase
LLRRLPVCLASSRKTLSACAPLACACAQARAALPTVFIDGEAGTTGLQARGWPAHARWRHRTDAQLVYAACATHKQVRERLAARKDLRVLSLPDGARKDESARRDALNSCDAAILCLPDDAAVAAVALLDASNTRTVIIDASTAFRTAPGWVYGFPELTLSHAAAVAASKRISNPGCYPTGFIALTRPLLDAGLLPPSAALVCHAISGYSGGGKALIKVFEEPGSTAEPWGAYGFNMAHKHLPEMARWSGLARPPVFCPAVGSFAQGMVVSVPLHYEQLKPGVTGEALHAALVERYAGCRFVTVMPRNAGGAELLERGAFLRPDALNGTNQLQLFVYHNDAAGTAWLAARLDNLGKGASGAAVQNLNLALGLQPDAGLL